MQAIRNAVTRRLRVGDPIRSSISRQTGLRYYSARVTDGTAPAVTTISDLLSIDRENGKLPVEVSGWVRNVRKSSAVRFLDISDGSSSTPLQAVVKKDMAKEIQFGASVHLKGDWKYRDGVVSTLSPTPSEDNETHVVKDSNTKPNGQPAELQVEELEILGHSVASTYPIQRKYATPESLRGMPHLRMRTPLNSAMLRLRSDVLASLTNFFVSQKFQQTHPPIITASDCEGAGETFRVEAGSKSDPFSETEQYLTVSSQLHLEAFAQALGNVWTLSPTFRAERSDTSRHLSEFYMLEAEMSFVDDMDQVLDFIQDMLRTVVQNLSQRDAWQELDNFRLQPRDPAERQTMADLDSRDVLVRRWNGMLATEKWPRITYTEAIQILQENSGQFTFTPTWGKSLQSEHERYLAENIGFDKINNAYLPVFVTHYPREIKAFYMRQSAEQPDQGPVFDCFDLIVPDLGELAGGSMREHRMDELVANMNQLVGREAPALDWYLDLRRWGCPPHGGFGIGFDRLLSYLSGIKSIRDIVAFPRLYGHIHC